MGRVLVVKEKADSSRGPGSWEFKSVIKNAEDCKQVAILLSDLAALGIPIDKAIVEYKKQKEEGFPW